jgi:hypothetical protein
MVGNPGRAELTARQKCSVWFDLLRRKALHTQGHAKTEAFAPFAVAVWRDIHR